MTFRDGIAVDTHTHSVLSGHAWSTVTENIRAAKEKGLCGLCVTEHGPAVEGGMPLLSVPAVAAIPPVVEGVRCIRGIEANIIDFSGGLDVPEKPMRALEFVIASYHSLTLPVGKAGQQTEAMLGALRNPCVDVLGHIHDPGVPCKMETLIREASYLGKLIELNASACRKAKDFDRPEYETRLRECARLCARYGARVCVASDAHFWTEIGEVTDVLTILESIGFPPELVVNLTSRGFEDYLQSRRVRLGGR